MKISSKLIRKPNRKIKNLKPKNSYGNKIRKVKPKGEMRKNKNSKHSSICFTTSTLISSGSQKGLSDACSEGSFNDNRNVKFSDNDGIKPSMNMNYLLSSSSGTIDDNQADKVVLSSQSVEMDQRPQENYDSKRYKFIFDK